METTQAKYAETGRIVPAEVNEKVKHLALRYIFGQDAEAGTHVKTARYAGSEGHSRPAMFLGHDHPLGKKRTREAAGSKSILYVARGESFHIYQYILLLLLALSPLLANCQRDSLSKNLPCYSQSGQLKIITWNIYMLPRLFVHTGQLQRAAEIANVLKNQDADIIVFEEAFDDKARGILRDSLKAYFPYESGDPRKNSWRKTSCGVWIISKVPIEVVKQIFFKESNGSDRLATKGAILVQGEKNGFCFELVGTHLQSDLNSGKNVQPIRDKQYAEIKKQLLEPYSRDNIPQFIAGDFNTIHDDSVCYNPLMDTLKFTPCKLEGNRRYSYDYTHNDLVIGTNNKPQLIDYIFYSAPAQEQVRGSMQIVVFSRKWSSRHKDLSDHFAISGVFNYGENNSTAFVQKASVKSQR